VHDTAVSSECNAGNLARSADRGGLLSHRTPIEGLWDKGVSVTCDSAARTHSPSNHTTSTNLNFFLSMILVFYDTATKMVTDPDLI